MVVCGFGSVSGVEGHGEPDFVSQNFIWTIKLPIPDPPLLGKHESNESLALLSVNFQSYLLDFILEVMEDSVQCNNDYKPFHFPHFLNLWNVIGNNFNSPITEFVPLIEVINPLIQHLIFILYLPARHLLPSEIRVQLTLTQLKHKSLGFEFVKHIWQVNRQTPVGVIT